MPVDVFANMNPRQREAIAHLEGPLSVIAGAGSGKTRVITHRIANLIQHGIRPDRILAITFTNKAAGEMKERVLALLGIKTPWITTFHSAGLRLLKLEQANLGFAHPFTVMDEDDHSRLLKRLIKELKIDPEDHPPNQLRWQISYWKNRMLTPDKVQAGEDQLVAKRLYQRLDEVCKEECLADFDDLLLKPVLLLRGDDQLLAKYQERFPYILIDEYQDTNPVQYELVKLLGGHRNVCATGDPDQAIYGWRGADIENILRFEQDFPGCKTVLLEQNYRSTKLILRAAQTVVEHNTRRKDKTIFTANEDGERLILITVDDQDDEAAAVAAAVERRFREGTPLKDMAVFYRTNAQSRVLEDWIRRRSIPYRIVGGTRFYERREVKDLLAYARLLINPRDSTSLERIINVPRRRIGDAALDLLRDVAHAEGVSLYEVLATPDLLERVAIGRNARPLQDFAALLKKLARLDPGQPMDCLKAILNQTGLEEFHLNDDPEQGPERVANLQETVTAAEPFQGEGAGAAGLEDFLDHVALLTSADDGRDQKEDQLVLMTLHAAKGLEFPVVFIVGCEQGMLPLARNNQPCDYEEERRLMYVGITRAMRRLYLSRAVVRSQYGRTVRNAPSMFLAEIPDGCIEHHDKSGRRTRGYADSQPGPMYPKASPAHRSSGDASFANLEAALAAGTVTSGAALRAALASRGNTEAAALGGHAIDVATLAVGDRIVHQVFGAGAVAELRGQGDGRMAVIAFDRSGRRELMLSFAAGRMRTET